MRLPAPTSTTDLYLRAVLAELRGLRDDLKQQQKPEPAKDEPVELKEPARRRTRKKAG